jgi:prepilin-type N-terminal cleavage/methylation domain-containing protein
MATFLFLVLPEQDRQMTTGTPQFARTARPASQSGFTLIELLIVVAMIAVLATIAFPILLRARITAHEGVAVASLRTIHSAEAAFASTCGRAATRRRSTTCAQAAGQHGGVHHRPVQRQRRDHERLRGQRDGSHGATTICRPPTPATARRRRGDGFVVERHPVSVGETGVRSFRHRHAGHDVHAQDGVTIDDALAGTIDLPIGSSSGSSRTSQAPPNRRRIPKALSGAGPPGPPTAGR